MQTRDDLIRELLDADTLDEASLDRNLRDIRRINGLLGWRAFTVRAVAQQVRALGSDSFSLLDIACGSADIPLAIARRAAHDHRTARIVASDISPQIVAVARREAADEPSVTIEQQDALALPYPAQSFDFTLCTLALHHFDPPNAVKLLREMARVGRRVLVFDIQRARLAYLGCVAMVNLLAMHPMTRHDAPASVRRSYSAAELRSLAEQAGLQEARVSARFPYRLALEATGKA
jgi:ubiquinone/menaquinone biosynthesis C-methylase UbiE